MAHKAALAAVLLVLFCAVALAQPCIECKDCRGSNNCLARCQRSCPQVQQVDGEKCKRYGREAGDKVAKESCDTTLTYCNGGQRPLMGAARRFTVNLSQCANIAYGVCQSTALDKYRWWGTCTQALRYGFKQCSKDQANTWFKDEVNDRCNTAVAWIDQQASG